jgi:hypothetical protein
MEHSSGGCRGRQRGTVMRERGERGELNPTPAYVRAHARRQAGKRSPRSHVHPLLANPLGSWPAVVDQRRFGTPLASIKTSDCPCGRLASRLGWRTRQTRSEGLWRTGSPTAGAATGTTDVDQLPGTPLRGDPRSSWLRETDRADDRAGQKLESG